MKKIISFLILISLFNQLLAQNVGIGTSEPLNKLHINGTLLVNTPAATTNLTPTISQVKTMVNSSTVTFPSTDSTGRIFDPGGPAGNYSANQLAYAFIDNNYAGCIGIEITAESMQLATGDSLFISEAPGYITLLAVGNGYTTTGKWVFNSPLGSLQIIFKSNSDANVGSGFSLLFRRLFDNSNSLPNVSGYAGKALYFDTKSGAFRSGSISNQAKGTYSTAMGEFTTASGNSSTAIGGYSSASGDFSTALGLNSYATGFSSIAMGDVATAGGNYSSALGYATSASGNYSSAMGYKSNAGGIKSTAFGDSTRATGDNATASGYRTLASADYSTAMGVNTTASGLRSTAMGNNASTNGQANSLAIGGTGTATICTAPNQFMTRFDNYTFWISAVNYAYLLPSSNGWAYTSDRTRKERFEELNGQTVLNKISGIPYYSWNFKDSATRQYRHYGIMAQDFYNAFGKDSYGSIGNDSTVSPLDMLGVAYSAIKELEKRTSLLQKQQEEKVNENNQLKANNLALQQRLDMLEKKINALAFKKEEAALVKKD